MTKEDRTLISFWNEAFAMSEAEREQACRECGADPGDLAPSEKLARAVLALGDCERVLDYGCGSGWAAILAAAGGCTHVTAADPAPNALEAVRFLSGLYGVSERIETVLLTPDWRDGIPNGFYDGLVCSNVLDVVPPETERQILHGLSEVLRPGGRAVVGLTTSHATIKVIGPATHSPSLIGRKASRANRPLYFRNVR